MCSRVISCCHVVVRFWVYVNPMLTWNKCNNITQSSEANKWYKYQKTPKFSSVSSSSVEDKWWNKTWLCYIFVKSLLHAFFKRNQTTLVILFPSCGPRKTNHFCCNKIIYVGVIYSCYRFNRINTIGQIKCVKLHL